MFPEEETPAGADRTESSSPSDTPATTGPEPPASSAPANAPDAAETPSDAAVAADAIARGESADEERPIPPPEPGDTAGFAESHFAPRGGWLGPTVQEIESGRVKREIAKPATLLAAVMHGETIKRVVCEGFNLSKKTISHRVEIVKSTLTRANLKGGVFEKAVIFRNCVIENLDIQRATFRKGITFEACEFRSPVTTFKGFTCEGDFRIRDCTVSGKLLIANARIAGTLDAWDATFTGWVDFRNVNFGGVADFRSIDSDEGFVFTSCTFEKSALFRGASIAKKFAFVRDCKLAGCLDLQKARLHGYCYFDELIFGDEATISVWNCTPNALLIKARQIEGRLQPLKDGDHAKAAEEYGVLKNNYQRLNWLDDEDWAYYHFKREQRLARHGQRGRLSRFFEYMIFDLACAYGTSPLRVLGTAAIIITFFALVYTGLLLGIPGDAADMQTAIRDGHPGLPVYEIFGATPVDKVLSAFIHATSAFVSGFDGVDKNVEGWPSILLTIEGLLGMLVLGLFIVAFSRKVVR